MRVSDDVAALGGDPDLAADSLTMHADTADNPLIGHYAMIGAQQPTPSTITLRDGIVEAHHHTFRRRGGIFDRDAHSVLSRYLEHGDGTVPLHSAQPRGRLRPTPIAQQHGPLASCNEASVAVQAILVDHDPHDDDRLGAGDIGIDLPDVVEAGTEFAVTITGIDSPLDAAVTVHNEPGQPVDQPTIHRADGRWQADIGPLPPGIHEVTVAGMGTSPITQLVLVDQP